MNLVRFYQKISILVIVFILYGSTALCEVPGTLLWEYEAGSLFISSPAIGPSHVVYTGSDDKNLYAFEKGSALWKQSTGGKIIAAPAIGSDGTIYIGSIDTNFYAYTTSGTLRWIYRIGAEIYSSAAIAEDGTIYVGADDNKLHAINPDGSNKWEFLTGAIIRCSPAIGVDGTIYVGSYDGSMYAVHPDGSLKWKYAPARVYPIYSSPAISTGNMAAYTLYLKYGELMRPGADRIFLFIDEREDAINWGNYLHDMTGYSPNNPGSYRWLDIPASYHGNACGISFCDGHSEIRRWKDGRTSRPILEGGVIFDGSTPISSPNNVDIGWMQDKTTRPKL